MSTASQPAFHRLEFPWGESDRLELTLPATWPVPIVGEPDRSGAVSDYLRALDAALDAPMDSPRLESLVRTGSRVAIVVDDPSRWTPVAHALPVILRRLHAAGVAAGDVSICVGVGRHHALDDASMRERLGDEIVAEYCCFSPPLDEIDQYDELGYIARDVPVRVFRPVARADVRVLVGSVLPHLQAGFGGGYKLIFPGCSHRSTLGALHRQGLGGGHLDAARLLGSDVRENPMRRAIRAAAALLKGHYFSISHVMGGQGEVLNVAAGDVDSVQYALSADAARRFRVETDAPADVVLAGNSPWPGDPMMSFKVLLNHRAAVRKGGVLAGFFWTREDELDRTLPMPALHAISHSGAPGAWVMRHALKGVDRALSLLKHPSRFMIRWARELVVDQSVVVYAPSLRRKFGRQLGPVGLFADQAELWAEMESRLGSTPHSVRAFPFGGLSFVVSR